MPDKSCFLYIAAAAFLLLAPGHANANDAYGAMVAELKKGNTSINYDALREAYAKSPDYDPYGKKVSKTLQLLFDNGDCKTVQTQAAEILESMYVNITSHLMAAHCYTEAGDDKEAEFHATVGKGLMLSLFKSGDGLTPETAFKVVTLQEEYTVLRSHQLKLQSQTVLNKREHTYDQMDVTDRDDNPHTLYFNVDLPLAAAAKTAK